MKLISRVFFSQDTASQSSYGSHKNRNFESMSHRNSVEELRNEKEQEKLALLIMNGNSNGNGTNNYNNSNKNGGILSKHHSGSLIVMEKPQRSVVIDDEDIDAYRQAKKSCLKKNRTTLL